MPRIFQKKSVQTLAMIFAVILLGAVLLTLIPTARSEEVPVASEHRETGFFRILVAAKDRASGLCDVMMLVSLNRETGETAILQIPRDTYVHLGEGGYRKINGTPASVGMERLCAYLGEAFGVSVDRYVRLSADAFRRSVDAIGGVELELDEPMDYEDPAQGLSIHLGKGTNTLSGEEAEWFVRYRADYLRGDLGRLDAQKLFLAAFAKKALATRSPVSLVRLGMSLLDGTDTDLSFSDLTMLTRTVSKGSAESLFFMTAPGGDVTGKDGGSYYVLSALGMKRILGEYFGMDRRDFDPKGYFLNRENRAFARVYETDAEVRVYTARELGSEGLEIPRAES